MKDKKMITKEMDDCYYIYKISNKNHQQIGKTKFQTKRLSQCMARK